jgi:hypothetical protein
MEIRKVKEDAHSIWLGWDPVPGVDGYRFWSAGVLRSRTCDPKRNEVKFSKGQEPYMVEAVVFGPKDAGTYPASTPPPVQNYVKVAPRVAYKEGGSDARFCCENQPGVVRDGDGWRDESGATYDTNGLCRNGKRSDGPAVTGALQIDGRPYCSLPMTGDPKLNSGSWAI